MKKLRKKLHLSDDGFSLMELIVTMLVSSIVIAATAGFLSAGMRYYQNANAETIVQTESQIAELFLTELLQESKDYKELSVAGTDATYALMVKRAISGTDVVSVVVLKDSQLWYADVTEGTDAAMINAVITAGKANAFLADHVTQTDVIPDDWSTAAGNKGLLNLKLKFNVSGKTYTETATVSLRNISRN